LNRRSKPKGARRKPPPVDFIRLSYNRLSLVMTCSGKWQRFARQIVSRYRRGLHHHRYETMNRLGIEKQLTSHQISASGNDQRGSIAAGQSLRLAMYLLRICWC
jgi:hypothetical protein